MKPSANGRFPDDRDSPDLVGFEWDEAQGLAGELGVKIVRIAVGDAGDVDAPHRVIRQVQRGGVIEVVTAAEAWTL